MIPEPRGCPVEGLIEHSECLAEVIVSQ